MKRFACPACDAEIHFDSLACLVCGTGLAYAPDEALFHPSGGDRPSCANRTAIGCNWEVGTLNHGTLCDSCALTETIPDQSVPGNPLRWARIEEAKRRLIYSIKRLDLPLVSPQGHRLTFRLLADQRMADGSVRRVLTGHEDGVVTLNIAEADDPVREALRVEMGEPYRTLLGHFRHEAGHFVQQALVDEATGVDGIGPGGGPSFVDTFGDPSQDYQAALQRHYAQGPAPGWPETHVSAYATSHPWEDFAETFAHWLHMVDGLETAARFGLAPDVDAYGREVTIGRLVAAWVPLSIAMNAMNRAMGQADFYPFVIAPAVVGKLGFVHRLRREARAPRDGIRPQRATGGVDATPGAAAA